MEDPPPENFEAVKASKGSHFQFQSEREWQSTNTPVTSRFTLNMKTLAEDLSTIPFYERQQLPKELFSEQELTAMDKDAQLHSDQQKHPEPKPISIPVAKKINHEQPSIVSSAVTNIQRDIKSLEIEEPVKKTDELEDWLDSVLDD
ncbi:uncharacterized protein Aven [Planococcus citri]|uniref:uncharacterized protein Aven n=1 Tax=Planococcus citri TaxID=170843 RepID=UPI0031F8A47C